MKLSSIVLSQAIRLGKVSGRGGGTIYGLNLTKACEERYGFLQGPKVLADYDLSKGVQFLHGYFDNVVIDRLQIFPNGILAEAKVDTDACDRFLDDLLKWLTERGGIEFTISEPPSRLYYSQLEIQSDIILARCFPQLSPLGREIGDILRSYGQGTPDYELSGLAFGPILNDPAGFRFEGREGAQHGIFFSIARLRTSDHLRVLDRFQALMTSAS